MLCCAVLCCRSQAFQRAVQSDSPQAALTQLPQQCSELPLMHWAADFFVATVCLDLQV
jgi:hypothetical protein